MVYCLDLETGSQVWNYTIGSPLLISPIVIDHSVFQMASNGTVYRVGNSSTMDDMYDTPPKHIFSSSNSTVAGSMVGFVSSWQDDEALSGYVFSWDNCNGYFTHYPWVSLNSSKSAVINLTSRLSSEIGCQFRWKFEVNDSSDQWSETQENVFITTGYYLEDHSGPWSKFKGNVRNNASFGDGPKNFTVKWTFDYYNSLSAPLNVDSGVFVSTNSGSLSVFMLDPNNGSVLHNYSNSSVSAGQSELLFYDDSLYVVTGNKIFSLDGYNLSYGWSAELPKNMTATSSFYGIYVLISSGNELYAYDVIHKEIAWFYVASDDIVGVAVYDGTAYLTSLDGYIHSINASNGNMIHLSQVKGSESISVPIISNNKVFFTTEKNLYEFNISSWQSGSVPFSRDDFAPYLAAKGSDVCILTNNHAICFDSVSLRKTLESPSTGFIGAAQIAADQDGIYILGKLGNIQAIDNSGSLVSELSLGSSGVFAAGSILYVSLDNNHLVAVGQQ